MMNEAYILTNPDKNILCSAKELLWKMVRSKLFSIAQLEQVTKVLKILERMPEISEELNVSISLVGPHRSFGEHEIVHWWEIKVEGQLISVESGGHFYRNSTGGDSFTCMSWSAYPGENTEFENYLNTLHIVDDVMPFEPEVRQIDLSDSGYSVTIYVDDEEITGNKIDKSNQNITELLKPIDEYEERLNQMTKVKLALTLNKKYLRKILKCDICGCNLNDRTLFIDGRLRGEIMWANMCSKCFFQRGEGIGWGDGQLYAKQPDGSWLMVAGFPTKEQQDG